MAAALPYLGLILGGVATIVAARLNSRSADRNAATGSRGADLTELRAMLEEQRTMLDRAEKVADRDRLHADRDRTRIEALEAEVAECEVGRKQDRREAAAALDQLRNEISTLRGAP